MAYLCRFGWPFNPVLSLPYQHSLKRHLCRQREPVAWGQVTRDVEMTLARRARVPSRATGHAERDCTLVSSRTGGRIRHLHEGIRFDEDLVPALHIRVSRL